MDAILTSGLFGALFSPAVFAALCALAALLAWLAIAPARPRRDVEGRLDDYLERGDPIVEQELARPLARRTFIPAALGVLRFFGNLMPRRNAEITEQMLQQAGRPLGMTALDYQGLRLMVTMGLGLLLAFVTWQGQENVAIAARNGVLGAVLGFVGVTYWLRMKVNHRKNAIQRALPDALDMMTIGVEAGLAFETAMVRVGDKWHNPLTEEMRRAVGEMRVGMTREEALRRMADRCGVEDLTTFVAVLVQSTNLGVSIAQVLHAQAAQMRLKRRLRAEELARQAGIKMVFPLVFLIFPALFVVILGPSIPLFIDFFDSVRAGGGVGVP
jgi:tight adherence protein C